MNKKSDESNKKAKGKWSQASDQDAIEFAARVENLLIGYQDRIQKLVDRGRYELRVVTVRSHYVRRHLRAAHQRVYLARKAPKK